MKFDLKFKKKKSIPNETKTPMKNSMKVGSKFSSERVALQENKNENENKIER